MNAVVITGASSGIGEALAREYARPGRLLALTGRNADRLEQVARACRDLGAEVETASIDVRDRAAMAAWLGGIDLRQPVHLLIANAGVIAGPGASEPIESADGSYNLIEVNLLGAMNAIHPLLQKMIERKSGQIAIMSSIAAFVPLSHAPSYSASKAALLNYGMSLRDALLPYGVKVNVITPGYIDTRMSRSERGPKPFLMTADRAAKKIAAGLERNREIIMFPLFFGYITWLSGVLPSWLRRAVSKPFAFSVKEKR